MVIVLDIVFVLFLILGFILDEHKVIGAPLR